MSGHGRLRSLPPTAIWALAIASLAACGGAAATAGPATPAPSGIVPITAREYAFTPAAVTVAAGTVTFEVRNGGNEEHEFEILQGETPVEEIEGIAAGQTKGLTVALAPGEYTFMCKLNGHDILGMKGTLTVTGG